MLTNTVGCIERTPSVITLTESSGDSLKRPFFMAPPTFALRHAPSLCVFLECVRFCEQRSQWLWVIFHSIQRYRLPWTPCKI